MPANQTSNPADAVRDIVLANVNSVRSQMTIQPRQMKEVLDEIAPRGEAGKVREFVGRQITILHVEPFIGRFGPAAFMIFADETGTLFNTVVGQKIMLPKLLLVADQLPVTTTIKKVEEANNPYYDFE